MGKIDIDDLAVNVDELLEDYKDFVYEALDDGLDAAEKILIRNLSAKSPKGKSKQYHKNWKSKGSKYKNRRYVGNTKTVRGKHGNVPLSNILEYSTKSKHQGLIKTIYLESVEQMVDAIEVEMKKGG